MIMGTKSRRKSWQQFTKKLIKGAFERSKKARV